MEPHPEKPVAQPDFEPLVTGRRAWVVLGAISLSSFQTALSLSGGVCGAARVDRGLPRSVQRAAFMVINVFNIVGAATLVLSGAIGERWGRKRIILLGTATFMVASVAAALAPNVMVLIAARVVAGAGFGSHAAGRGSHADRRLPAGKARHSHRHLVGCRGSGGSSGAIAGRFSDRLRRLAGGVLDKLALGAVAFVATWLVIPEYRLETKTKELLPTRWVR